MTLKIALSVFLLESGSSIRIHQTLLLVQSNLGYPNVDFQKLLGYSKMTDSPDFFSIIYCNKTIDYSNFDYPKN